MPLRRGFSAGRLTEAAEESVKKARESFKDELRGLLTELRELSCRHFLSPLLFSLTFAFVLLPHVDLAGTWASTERA